MSKERAKNPTVIFYGYTEKMETLIEKQFEAGTRAFNRGAGALDEEKKFNAAFANDVTTLAKLVVDLSPIAVIHEFGKENVRDYTNDTLVHEYSSVETQDIGVIPLMRQIFEAAKLI
jgi:hypothetical protein